MAVPIWLCRDYFNGLSALIIVSARRNLDCASQALLHPGYTGCGPNDDHGRIIDNIRLVYPPQIFSL